MERRGVVGFSSNSRAVNAAQCWHKSYNFLFTGVRLPVVKSGIKKIILKNWKKFENLKVLENFKICNLSKFSHCSNQCKN